MHQQSRFFYSTVSRANVHALMAAILLWLSLNCAEQARACSCMVQEQSGFVHATAHHLPANARGVLLLYAPLNHGVPGNTLPDAAKVTVTDIGSGRKLRASIEPIKLDPAYAEAPLFRVVPQGGFKRGKTYQFSYFSSEMWAYPNHLEVTIDATPIDPAQATFTLKTAGEATRRLLSLPRGDVCSEMVPRIAQDIAYDLSQPYLPYADSLVFFSQKRNLTDAQGKPVNSNFASFAYRDSMCTTVPFGGSAVGKAEERVHAACTLRSQPAARMQVRGYAGMLELSDKLIETPVLDIDFSTAQGEVCDTFGFLDQAIAKKDTEAIRTQACALQSIPSEDRGESPPSLVSTLAGLTESSDLQTRQCAAQDLLIAAYKVKTLDAATARAILQAMLARIDQGDAAAVSMRYHTLGDFAEAVLRSIAEGKASPTLSMSLFDPLVPRLTPFLTGRDAASVSLRYEAARILRLLGPRAKDAVPALLAALPDDKNSDIAETLLAIAPDDSHAPQALIEAAAKGNALAAHAYVNTIGKRHPKESVSILIRLFVGGDNYALYDLARYAQDDPRVMETLLAAADKGNTRAADVAAPLLEASDPAAAVTLYIVAMGDKSEGTRVIDKLGNMGAVARPAVPALFEAAQLSDVWRHLVALMALAKIGGDEAFNKRLIALILNNLAHDPEISLRALGRMGEPANIAKPQVFALLSDHPPRKPDRSHRGYTDSDRRAT